MQNLVEVVPEVRNLQIVDFDILVRQAIADHPANAELLVKINVLHVGTDSVLIA